MSVIAVVWFTLLGLAGLVWTSRHREVSRSAREQIPLSSTSFDGPPDPAPRLSVLVAAKDEEKNIETCVRTLLQQDYPNFELIVINDRSTDRTQEILESIAAGDQARLKIVQIEELREGWFGKNNAMREGVERAGGEWLCFSDADCRQVSDKTLSIAMRKVVDENIDLLSIMPVLETKSLWERIVQPVCAAVMVFWFHPRRVNDPSNKAAYANGAFMLMKRRAYDDIGGHEVVKTEVNEDVHMARLTKEHGLKLHVVQNDDLYKTRMYDSLANIWRGWSRIFYGCFGSFRRLLVSLTLLLMFSVFPWFSLAASGVMALLDKTSGIPWLVICAVSLLVVIVQQSVIARFYRLAKSSVWLTPTYIVGAVLAAGMLINAILKLNGRTATTWRGTTYRGDSLACGKRSG